MVQVVAASVRGPSHVRNALPCQDAWLAKTAGPASLAVVCDGVGSAPKSRDGARAATRAAYDAWRLWRRSPVGAVDDLIRLVEVAWRLRLGATASADAATTCLIYAEDDYGRGAVAQLGDGLIARRSPSGAVTVHPTRGSDFGITRSLGAPHTLADWSYTLTEPIESGSMLLMATDGVSEDVDPDRIGDLAAWVAHEIGALKHRGRVLAQRLRHWPVPHHKDDKTLLVLWKS